MNVRRKRHWIPGTVLFPMVLGTILNPLNSSMISVALVVFAAEFAVSAATVTWVVSAFYLTACIGQPLMGRFADRFGPRRVFMFGMGLVVVSGVCGPFSPNIAVLVGIRVIQALGTSAAFPSAIAVIRSTSTARGLDVQSGLSVVATINSIGAGVGPFVGGLLIVFAGWESLFWLNVPLALIAMVTAWRWVPRDTVTERVSWRALASGSDIFGIGAFSVFIVTLLVFLISVTSTPQLWLIPILLLAAVAFFAAENRSATPFINLRMLRHNRSLLGVYGHFVLFNIVFYCAMYGLPQWLEASRGLSPAQIGFLIFPIAMMSGLMTPVASWVIRRWKVRLTVTLGGILLFLACSGLLLIGRETPIWFIVFVCIVIGTATAMTNLGLQSRMYWAASGKELGVAAGLFQTSRYLGGILATSLLGIAFASHIDAGALHSLAVVMIALSLVTLFLSFTQRDLEQPQEARAVNL